MLEISKLKVSFNTDRGKVTVLDNIDLKINTGEKAAIIGESGSGKTTLALTILGLAGGIVEGSIKYKGEELTEKKALEWEKIRSQKIAMVFQNTGEMLNPVYKIIDQVMEPYLKANPGRKKEAFEKASTLLKSTGLSPNLFEAYPFTLSGGEIQKILIAMALINDPELLVMDEPTSALDALTRAELVSLLEEICRDKTVLIISHDLSVVSKFSQRTIVLYAGTVVEVGPTEKIIQSPRHPYTRGLIRAYPTTTTVKELQEIRGEFPFLEKPPAGCRFHPRCTQYLEKCSVERPLLVECGGRLLACHRGGIINLLRGESIVFKYPSREKNFNNNSFKVLNDVSISLYEGETLSLVGESGSGKSTLAHVLAGIKRPVEGRVFWEDKDIYSLKKEQIKEMRRYLQLIFQNAQEAVSHRMTVKDLVQEPLVIQGIGKDDKVLMIDTVKKTLRKVGLPDDEFFLHKYPHELSGGELQRVVIARGLILNPKVLIADEPFASLDASIQAKIVKLLMKLQNQQGFALMLITHDLALAGKVSDRVAVMFRGKIVEIGPSSKILRCPVHPYTKILLQMSPSLEQKFSSFKRAKYNRDAGDNGCPYIIYCQEPLDICFHISPSLCEKGFSAVACHRS